MGRCLRGIDKADPLTQDAIFAISFRVPMLGVCPQLIVLNKLLCRLSVLESNVPSAPKRAGRYLLAFSVPGKDEMESAEERIQCAKKAAKPIAVTTARGLDRGLMVGAAMRDHSFWGIRIDHSADYRDTSLLVRRLYLCGLPALQLLANHASRRSRSWEYRGRFCTATSKCTWVRAG